MNKPPQQSPIGRPNPGLNIDIEQTTEVKCGSCENTTFIQVYKMRKLSALLSPTGKETMIPIQMFSCAKCGFINDEFEPKPK